MNRVRISALPALLLAIAACHDAPTGAGTEAPHNEPTLAISDAVHQAGVPQFYWLPPTVPNPGPLVQGVFDPNLLGGPGVYPQLEVRFCAPGVTALCPATGAGSFATFNGYSSTPITIHQAGNYQLLWNKNPLVSGNTYRAWVLVTPAADASPLVLGLADVKVVSNSQALKLIDANEFVGLVAGNPLYLKFTVRTGIPGALTVALGSSTLAPGGSTTATATVTDLHGVPLTDAVVTWAVTPSGSPPGSVAPGSSTTDGTGTATTTLTAGGSAASGAVTATVGAGPAQLTGSASFTIAADEALVGDGMVAGLGFTCALTSAAVPYCWGFNDRGQLGNNSTSNSSSPVAVALPAGVSGFVHLAASFGDLFDGGGFACGLTSAGAAYCWGANNHGQLGNGSTLDSHAPVMVSLPAGVSGFAQLAAGAQHACAVTATGAAYCWGNNGSGQLGNGSTTESHTPVMVNLSSGVSFVKVTAGAVHSCGLTATGDAYCWGGDGVGQLGNGSAGLSLTPVAVSLPAGVSFSDLTSGDSHTCGLTAAGEAYCWGEDGQHQLGNGPAGSSDVPDAVILPAGESFAFITAGAFHTCALTSTGEPYCWGIVVDGEELQAVALPAGVSGFVRLAAGIDHTCGLTSMGSAYCWGFNWAGQLGDGSTNDNTSPVLVSGGIPFRTP